MQALFDWIKHYAQKASFHTNFDLLKIYQIIYC